METKITKRTVDAAASGERDQFLWDTESKGFGLKVTPAGSKVYILQYRMAGRGSVVKRFTIGKHGSPWTPEEARTEAIQLLRLIADGTDPAAAKAAAMQPKEPPKDTMALLLAEFVERWVKKRNRSWKERERTLNYDVLPRWGQRRIGEIKRTDIIELLDEVIERGAATQANRVFSMLRKFFNWAIERGIIETSPMTRMKPPAPEKERDRWLNDGEIGDLWQACDVVGWPFGPLVKLLILTGQRRDEVASLHWADINVADKMWTIPKERAKNGRAHQVPLSPAALAIIEALPHMPERRPKGDEKPEDLRPSPLVFTTTGNTYVSGFSRIKLRLDGLMRRRKPSGPKRKAASRWPCRNGFIMICAAPSPPMPPKRWALPLMWRTRF